jgi:hypothetical protein
MFRDPEAAAATEAQRSASQMMEECDDGGLGIGLDAPYEQVRRRVFELQGIQR